MSWTLRRATDAMAETLALGFDGYRAFAGHGWQPPDVRTVPELARLRAGLEVPSTWATIAEGYGRMRFYTPRGQARARAFYEREGFSHTGWEGLEEPLGLVLVEYAREPLR